MEKPTSTIIMTTSKFIWDFYYNLKVDKQQNKYPFFTNLSYNTHCTQDIYVHKTYKKGYY